MISSSKNKLFESVFGAYIKSLLKKHFYKIHLSGKANLKQVDASLPNIFYCNHSNWWDGFVTFYLAHYILHVDSYFMMDIEQMRKYKFFKWLGVFSVDRNSPKSALKSIEHAMEIIQGTNKSLWIYPQGIMLPNDTRPLKFYSGITKLSQNLGKVNLVPFALRYDYLMEQRPEIFIQIGSPDTVQESITDKKAFTLMLQNKLTTELDWLKERVINNDTGDFHTIFRGKDSRNKTIVKIYTSAD